MMKVELLFVLNPRIVFIVIYATIATIRIRKLKMIIYVSELSEESSLILDVNVLPVFTLQNNKLIYASLHLSRNSVRLSGRIMKTG